MGKVQFSKAIRFSAGLNQAGANFTLTCKFKIKDPERSELIENEFSKIHDELEHKHFNHDFPQIKKPKLELQEVFNFLIAQIQTKLPDDKLVWCELNKGDLVRIQAMITN